MQDDAKAENQAIGSEIILLSWLPTPETFPAKPLTFTSRFLGYNSGAALLISTTQCC